MIKNEKKKIPRRRQFDDPVFQSMMYAKMNNPVFADLDIDVKKTLISVMWDVWTERNRFRTCNVCHRGFMRRANQLYCSQFCSGKAARKRQKERKDMEEEIRREIRAEMKSKGDADDGAKSRERIKSGLNGILRSRGVEIAETSEDKKTRKNERFLQEWLPVGAKASSVPDIDGNSE